MRTVYSVNRLIDNSQVQCLKFEVKYFVCCFNWIFILEVNLTFKLLCSQAVSPKRLNA